MDYACQAPLSTGFSRQEYWSGLPGYALRLMYLESKMLFWGLLKMTKLYQIQNLLFPIEPDFPPIFSISVMEVPSANPPNKSTGFLRFIPFSPGSYHSPCSLQLRSPGVLILTSNYVLKRLLLLPFYLFSPSWNEVAQSFRTLWDPMGCSPPGSSVHGILQARILEWVAIFFTRESSQPRDQTQVSRIAGRCFNLWATGEVGEVLIISLHCLSIVKD